MLRAVADELLTIDVRSVASQVCRPTTAYRCTDMREAPCIPELIEAHYIVLCRYSDSVLALRHQVCLRY